MQSETTTSAAWWTKTRTNDASLIDWLFDQYRGEVTAAARIEAPRDQYSAGNETASRTLTAIADQERDHASWVADLLKTRGHDPEVRGAPEARYWRETLPQIADLETGCAIGAHAEKMRLERIEAIVADEHSPSDIRAVFALILPQERWHERAFRSLSTPAAMEQTRGAHELGRAVLGLSA